MIISTAKLIDQQSKLFETRRVLTMGEARYQVGDLCEQLTADLTGAIRLKTDSNADICPDLHLPPDRYIETKAVGQSRRVIIYTHRLAKDRRFIDEHSIKLEYWIWQHGQRVTDLIARSDTVEEFQAAIKAMVWRVVVIEFDKLEKILLNRPDRLLNTDGIKRGPNAGQRLGYGGKGYGRGWDIPVDLLLPAARGVVGFQASNG